jgi:hypothetical protein
MNARSPLYAVEHPTPGHDEGQMPGMILLQGLFGESLQALVVLCLLKLRIYAYVLCQNMGWKTRPEI